MLQTVLTVNFFFKQVKWSINKINLSQSLMFSFVSFQINLSKFFRQKLSAYQQKHSEMTDKKQKMKVYSRLVQLDDKCQLQNEQKQKLTSVLENEVQFLLNKKEKQKEKKNRIKLLEQEFERKRKMQIQQFQLKNQQSQKTKQTVLKIKLQKNKKNLQHVQKVHKKANDQNHSLLKQGLQRRKQFYSEQMSRLPKSSSSKTQTQQNFRKNSQNKSTHQGLLNLNHSRTALEMDQLNMSVQEQIKKIQQKLSKAKNNHQFYQSQLLNRFQEKERRNSQIQEKNRSHSMIKQQKDFKQTYGKNEQIIEADKKVKGLTEKHLGDRRKSFQQKIKKLHENIRHIESEKHQKYFQLETKFSKVFDTNSIPNRTTSNAGSHRQRVLMNNLKLQQEKNHKAEQILKRHSDITTKNKIFKERKDLILQAIKKVNPEVQQ